MKKILFLILSLVLILPSTLKADNYKQLWREVQASAQKDLPLSEAESLRRIISKATLEASYGNLLKAESRLLDVMGSISNDSIGPIVDEIKLLEEKSESTDPALSAVLNTVLGKIYSNYPFLSDDAKEKAKQYYLKALENPTLLASKKALSYEPFVIHGVDSRLFNNDLLSLLGQQTEGYDVMRSYYMTTGNRVATMLSSLWMLKKNVGSQAEGLVLLRKSPYLASLDSLINLYGDLEACCEVAIERYRYMAMCSDVTVEDRYTFLNMAIGKWGGWKSANTLRNELTTLTNPFLECSLKSKVVFSEGKAMLSLESRNIQTIKIVTSRLTLDADTNLKPDDDEGYKELKKHINPISINTKEKKYIGQPEYRTLEDSIDLGTLPVGVYLLEVSTKKKSVKKMRSLLYVTSMYVINEKLPQNKTRIAVVNAVSGQPIKEATLELGLNKGGTRSVSLDEKGEYVFSSDTFQINSLRAWMPTDKAAPSTYSWNNFSYYDTKGEKDVLNLYTDRKVYRPGQTVHVTAILLSNQDGISTKAIEGREFTLSLKGANSKEIGKVKVSTDDYGTAAADFTLPQDGLTGNFQIIASNGAQGNLYVRVEEYVRPTFQVEFPEINSKYSPGDTLEVTAHATSYSGVPVQGAKVRYQIKRSGALWWRFYSPTGSFAKEETIFSRETVTDDDGAFIVEIPMLLPEWTKDSGISESEFMHLSRIYTITATADVTDLSGETREGELSLPLGNKPIAFACDIPSIVPRDSLKTVTFTLKNSQGADVSGTVRYYVDSSFNAFTAKANSPTEITWNTKETLPSGKHTLTAYCEGDTLRQEFTIFGLDDKKPATQTPAWFYSSSNEFPLDGSPVYLQIGSSESNVHVLYTAMSGSNIIDSGTIELNNEIITHPLKYDEKYGSGLLISVAWVKGGKLYTHNFSIKRGLPDKKLNLKWSTFRDRLTPGQKEEWTLSVTGPDGKAVASQLLSTMYDASLDDIMPQKWSFTDNIYQNLPSAMWKGSAYSQLSLSAYGSSTPLNVKHLEFNSLDLASISLSNYTPRFLTRLGGVRAPRMLSFNLSEKEAPVEEVSLAATAETQTNAQDNSSSAQPLKSNLRENFEETAFFFSNLLTDSKGNVKIKFTLPESLTSWRFLGLAHDKDMNYGLIEATILASKTVMIQPNMPRFVRVGDKASISSKVFNSSDRDVKAQVTIRLRDAETLNQVYQKSSSVTIKANKTEVVSFYYEVKEAPSLLICDITVSGNDFSDGERHYLPVLPNSESVTYSMPITDSKAGVSTFDISEIFPKNSIDGRLTIELTQNPAWLMIGALEYINEQKEDNAISLASALYANRIGKFIIDKTPNIKEVISSWQTEEDLETLKSSLEKNQDLKAIALEETPWLNDAIKESDQKKAIANFLDEEKLQDNLSQILKKLSLLQTTDGAFRWWTCSKGGSIEITSSVLELLTRLSVITGEDFGASSLIKKARGFIESRILEDAKKISENAPTYFLNLSYVTRYLYSNAISGVTPSKDVTKACEILTSHYKKEESNLSIYDKAIDAVIKAYQGDKSSAENSLKSLEEYSVVNKDGYRYYDTRKAMYSWCDFKIPTEVAVIEAMEMIDPETYQQTILEMKRWLLSQKRVQAWDTPVNTTNAIYAFLKGNNAQLETSDIASIYLDGKKLSFPKATEAIGYVKTSLNVDKAQSLKIEKQEGGDSWGAAYYQTILDLEDINSSSNGFSIKREILYPDGSIPETLTVGDKVKVRITITSDRDYDFVQVADKHAACFEAVNQLSGYAMSAYRAPTDTGVNYFFDTMTKGTHAIESEFYVVRKGTYLSGTCKVECAYCPEYSALDSSEVIVVK